MDEEDRLLAHAVVSKPVLCHGKIAPHRIQHRIRRDSFPDEYVLAREFWKLVSECTPTIIPNGVIPPKCDCDKDCALVTDTKSYTSEVPMFVCANYQCVFFDVLEGHEYARDSIDTVYQARASVGSIIQEHADWHLDGVMGDIFIDNKWFIDRYFNKMFINAFKK